MKMYPRGERLFVSELRSCFCQLIRTVVIAAVLRSFFNAYGVVTAQSGSCESGWTLKGQSCYTLTPEELTWSQAQEKCRSMNGLLAEVHNDGEQAALNDFLNSQVSEVWSAWIGLNDMQSDRNFIWGSGRPLTYSKWSESEPNNEGGNEHCVNVWPKLGSTWNDYTCTNTLQGVCQKGLCASGWTSTRGSCYQLTEEATRDAARDKCNSLDGSLVEITNANQQEELQDFLRSQGAKAFIAWIGLRDPQKNRVWKWDSGADLTYQKWMAGEPNNAGGQEFCVNVWQSNNFDWNDVACDFQYPGVCKQNKANGNEPPSGTIIPTEDALGCIVSDRLCRRLRQCTICAIEIFKQLLDSKWLRLCDLLNRSGFCTEGIFFQRPRVT